MNDSKAELREFTVRYVAGDGEIRRTIVMAKNTEDAETVAWDEDNQCGWCDGSMHEIIDVS